MFSLIILYFAGNLFPAPCQDPGKVSLANLAERPLPRIQTRSLDVCPSIGPPSPRAPESRDRWRSQSVSDQWGLASQWLFAVRSPGPFGFSAVPLSPVAEAEMGAEVRKTCLRPRGDS